MPISPFGSVPVRAVHQLQTRASEVTRTKKEDAAVVMEQRKKNERRADERRKHNATMAVERRQGERREKVNRRRQIDPTTCERDYNDAEVEFMHALDDYKRRSGRMFPTCSEILEVLMNLGYEKRKPSCSDASVASAAK